MTRRSAGPRSSPTTRGLSGSVGPENLALDLLIAEWPEEITSPLGAVLFRAGLPPAGVAPSKGGWERLSVDVGAVLSAGKSYLHAVVNRAFVPYDPENPDAALVLGSIGFGTYNAPAPPKSLEEGEPLIDPGFTVFGSSGTLSVRPEWLTGDAIGKQAAAKKGSLAWEGEFTAAATPTVPEPGTLALLATGGTGLVGGWYRKKRKAALAA